MGIIQYCISLNNNSLSSLSDKPETFDMIEKPVKDLFPLVVAGIREEGSEVRDSSPTSTIFVESKSDGVSSCATLDVNSEAASPPPYQQLSTTRRLLAHIGATMALFLATTDATIVSTSLPTMAREFHATQTQYTWVGVAYLLTQTAFQPLYGRLLDLIGRKPSLLFSMVIFALGSLLCGVAQNVIWLISARALAGIGGGGIVSSVWVITSEIVEIPSRPKWSQALSITWCCSAVAGPLLGGLFTGEHNSMTISWRWGFYINLPITFVALIILLPALHGVQFPRPCAWHTFAQRFDFGGLILFMFGSGFIIVGFSFATLNGWSAPSTICFIIFGFSILVCGGRYEKVTTRDRLFPETTFKDLTTSSFFWRVFTSLIMAVVAVLLISFLHNFAFNAGTFYLALFYQAANNSTPFEAGLRMLPYSLGSSLASMPVAWFIDLYQNKTHDTFGQNLVITLGLLISTAGFGLLMLLHEHAHVYSQVLFPLVAGIGVGMEFHAPYQVFTRALKPKEIASGTSAFFLVRFTGATVGLAVAGAIYSARMAAQVPPDVLPLLADSAQLVPLGAPISHAVSLSIQTVWAVCSPCLGIASLLSLLIRRIPIDASSSIKGNGRCQTTQKDPNP